MWSLQNGREGMWSSLPGSLFPTRSLPERHADSSASMPAPVVCVHAMAAGGAHGGPSRLSWGLCLQEINDRQRQPRYRQNDACARGGEGEL